MKLNIIYQKEALGQAEFEADGLFWRITCRLEPHSSGLFRLYGVQHLSSEYLGIPDADGVLRRRVPRAHMPSGFSVVCAAREARGPWLPWAGQIDGVPVEEALLYPTADALQLALPPEEMVKFPEWLEYMTRETIAQRDYAVLPLMSDGTLPQREIENGGTEDETMDRSSSADRLPDNTAAGDGSGAGSAAGENNREKAGCPDL